MSLLHAYLFGLLVFGVQGYFWDMVENANDYNTDTVYHQSQLEGTQSPCRLPDGLAAGRDHSVFDSCYYPYGGEEYAVAMPFEVLVRDPVTESMVWEPTTSVTEIRESAVVVCMNCDVTEMYVCATPEHGPGKLVVWADNDIVCYVSYYGEELLFYDSYQVLMADPAYEYRLTEVNYYLDELEVLEDTPLHMAEATLINNDDSDHVIVHTLTYSKTSTNEWQNTLGFVIGAAMSVSAGIPLFVESGWEVSAEQTFEYSYGESHTESIEVSLEAQVTVPAKHSCRVSIVARQMVADVPYDATVTVYFPDETTTTQYVSGVYEGLSVSQDTVQIDECIPLSQEYLNYHK